MKHFQIPPIVTTLFCILVVCCVFSGCDRAEKADTPEEPVTEKPEKTPDLSKKDPTVMSTVGQKAPEFTLPNEKGEMISLASFRDKKNVVLIFYPGDDTPGCTKQLCAVRDDILLFNDADTAAFGVNHQSAESHQKFITKFSFPFSLLVDSEKKAVNAYGCGGGKSTKRTVFGINKQGTIVFAQRGMPTNMEILEAFN